VLLVEYLSKKLHFNTKLNSDSACPDGWNLFDDVCIQISSQTMTFDLAKSTGCQKGVFWSQSYLGFWMKVNSIFIPHTAKWFLNLILKKVF
jgi:hypothetical protein